MKIDLRREDLKKKLIAAASLSEDIETTRLLGEVLALIQAQADIIESTTDIMRRTKVLTGNLIKQREQPRLWESRWAIPETTLRADARNLLNNIEHVESRNAAK